jgi:hypothetical protein
MLYDSGSGQLATRLYVVATTNSTNFHEQPTSAESPGIFRTDLTEIIAGMTLSVTGLPVWEDSGGGDIPETFVIMSAADGGSIQIQNTTENPLTTRGLYLTNSSNSRLWRMPAMIVRAGGTINIITNDSDNPAMKRGRANFNVNSGQRIRLTDSRGNNLSVFEVE